MSREVKSIDEMRGLVDGGGNLHDVVFHYTCPVCGKRKKITIAQDTKEDGSAIGFSKMFVGDKTRLEVVLAANGRCVRCSINAGELDYKGCGGAGDDFDDDEDEY